MREASDDGELSLKEQLAARCLSASCFMLQE